MEKLNLKGSNGLTNFADFIDSAEKVKKQKVGTRNQYVTNLEYAKTIGDAITIYINF